MKCVLAYLNERGVYAVSVYLHTDRYLFRDSNGSIWVDDISLNDFLRLVFLLLFFARNFSMFQPAQQSNFSGAFLCFAH